MSGSDTGGVRAGWTHWIVTGWPLWKVLLPAVGVPAVIAGSILSLTFLWGAPPLDDLALILVYSGMPLFLAVVLPVQKYFEGPRRVGLSADGVTIVFPRHTESVPWDRVDPPSYSRPTNPRAPNPFPYHLHLRDLAGQKTSVQFATFAVVRELMDFPSAPAWRRDPALRRHLGLPEAPPGSLAR